MAEKSTLARPYARAVFELARDKGAFDRWSKTLSLLSALSADKSVQAMLSSPKAAPAVRAEVLAELAGKAGEKLDPQARNFVALLSENRRLTLLPEIAADYERLRAEAENTLEVEIAAAMPVDAAEQKLIADALHKKLGRKITLKYVQDKTLIGGAVIRAGDLVIDGSVREKLGRLAASLIN
ncbi:MAG TPA: F0F1 ATP synthase subunit delta [Gammaproteobacteria bacterium]|jgi:F-type H+-transporting ATPase subunit delta|nr:F0F1 ATP synthase subunit delta [Gammaproteobacteria bacterium]